MKDNLIKHEGTIIDGVSVQILNVRNVLGFKSRMHDL